MPPRISGRLALVFITALGLLAVSACQAQPGPEALPKGPVASKPSTDGAATADLKDEIPTSVLAAVLAKHFEGLGYMEQYEYAKAIAVFQEVHDRAPGWIAGSINLAIALLNDTGVKAEAAKKSGSDPASSNFDEALNLLAGVLERDPNNAHAHFCRGIILEQQGNLLKAYQHFKRVTEIDPRDAAGWYWLGSTLTDPEDSSKPAGPDQAREQMALFAKALDLDPYLTPAIYKMAMASRFAREPKKTKDLFDRWKTIDPDRQGPTPGPGNVAGKSYGEMGTYASVVNPFARYEPAADPATKPPNFEAARPLVVKLAENESWAKPSHFTGSKAVIGRVRARFGAAVAAFDADGDGKLDLYLASAVVGPKGVRDILLLNKGEGRFEDASDAFGLSKDRASLGVAAADFDADRHIDLFLTGLGDNRLLRNRGGKTFEDISSAVKPIVRPALSLTARWLDLDQDGDLDLYVINYCAAEHADKAFVDSGGPPPGLRNAVYRNDGQPEPIPGSPPSTWAPLAVAVPSVQAKGGLSIALTPWTGVEALNGGEAPHTGIAALDIDNDRDLDLLVASDGGRYRAILNDRLGQFHESEVKGISSTASISGLLVTDFDADGRSDLVAAAPEGRVLAWRNTSDRSIAGSTNLVFEPWPIDATRWRAAQAIDLDLDGWPDLLGLPTASSKLGDVVLPSWARDEGKRFAAKSLALGLEEPGLDGLIAVDLVGDPLPDILVIRPGAAPALARNLGNGNHWLALNLGGHWQTPKVMMRTNSHGIGTRVLLEGQGIHAAYEDTTTESGLGQSIAPFVLGLGRRDKADLLHLRWPDGVLQCELNLAANQVLSLDERNRKTSSCPVLFTWNGQRFVCLGDFLGGGGLGYLVAPGVYSQPDRDEAVAIAGEQLRPIGGAFRVSITEPMDEIAYIDHVRLEVVDRPPGISSSPDERFAPEGPRPTGELLAWRTQIEPVRAEDLKGRDLTETLRHRDRRTADDFRKYAGWIGYAEEHGIILDFGDRLSRFSAEDRLVLCLAGWVEYPYSQTNYAAATAGVALKPPAIERRRSDGSWEVIEPHAGYPAGMPRLMTLELSGKLAGPSCVLRIKTNMECYYDQAFIAVRDRSAESSLRVATLPVARAVLGYRGYTREVSPDGRQPLLYDYDYVDPAPLARFSGRLTRYGDVAGLLQNDDDRLCLIGPGDEARIEFDAAGLPPLPDGWTRCYVLRSYGYCKDSDPFTAASDTVGPLPWRGMPAFPFGPGVERTSDPAYESYLREYQTRPAGEGD
jgi:tetratricopeptide (TPR) repeat protein